jgi:hypothetical protein
MTTLAFAGARLRPPPSVRAETGALMRLAVPMTMVALVNMGMSVTDMRHPIARGWMLAIRTPRRGREAFVNRGARRGAHRPPGRTEPSSPDRRAT